ncbi:MAG: hypothetical protein VB022_03505 [Rikenellaceae bacterium]|nr:hypothetical protein [Rikenellaceae bacterium]
MKKILRLTQIFIVSLLVTSSLSSCGFFDDVDDGYDYGKALVKVQSEYNNLELQIAYSPYGLITTYSIIQNGVVKETYSIDYFEAYVRISALAGENTDEVYDVYYDNLGKATLLKDGFTTIRQFDYNSSNLLKQEILYSTSNPLVEYTYNNNTISQIVQYNASGEELSQEDLEDYEIKLSYKTVGLLYMDLMYNPYGNYRPLLSLIGIAGTLPTNFAGESGKFSNFQYDVDGYLTDLIMTVDGVPYDISFTYDDESE